MTRTRKPAEAKRPPVEPTPARFGRMALWWEPAIEAHLARELEAKRPAGIEAAVTLRVALAISTYAHKDTLQCYPSQESIAARAGVSLRQAERAVAVLKAVGIIRTIRRQRLSLVYAVALDDPKEGNLEPPSPCEATANQDVVRTAMTLRDCGGSKKSRTAMVAQNDGGLEPPRPFGTVADKHTTEHTNDDVGPKEHDREPRDLVVEALAASGFVGDARREANSILEQVGAGNVRAFVEWYDSPQARKANSRIGYSIGCAKRGATLPKAVSEPAVPVYPNFVPKPPLTPDEFEAGDAHIKKLRAKFARSA